MIFYILNKIYLSIYWFDFIILYKKKKKKKKFFFFFLLLLCRSLIISFQKFLKLGLNIALEMKLDPFLFLNNFAILISGIE